MRRMRSFSRLALALLLSTLFAAGCAKQPTFLVVSIESTQPLAGLTSLRATVVHSGSQASVEVKSGTFEIGTTPVTFALEIEAKRRGPAMLEVTAMRDTIEAARVRTDVTLGGGTVRVTLPLTPTEMPTTDGMTQPACGARNQTCCAPDNQCDASLLCDGGVCVCGSADQPCCAGAICNNGFVCAGDACECGSTGQPCCGGSACATGNTCGADTLCQPCGNVGDACCGSSCNTGLVCNGSVCECGGAGQPCCAGDTCGVELACAGGLCASCLPTCAGCGGEGQACCTGGVCSVGLLCDGTSCSACGADGEPCCAGMLCGNNLECGNAKCRCGGRTQPCCDGTTCGADLVCKSGKCQCGGKNQPCCDGTKCNTDNLTCVGGNCQCGALGQPCCAGDTCNTGLGCGVNHTCASFGGLFAGEDSFETSCAPCRVTNSNTGACSCSSGFTLTSLRDLSACRDPASFHGATLGICSTSTVIEGSDFGGFYQKDDTACRDPNSKCPVPNAMTGKCSCPAGYSPIVTQEIVDVSFSCSPLGYVGTDTAFCVSSTAPLISFGGVYQQDLTMCEGAASSCRVSNPLANNQCDCPAAAPRKVEVEVLVDCTPTTRVNSRLVFCLP